MATQVEHAATFANLHIKGDPLVLFNIWDAGTAQAVRDSGAKAIATGSWAVAAAHGYPDREKLPLDLALANLRRIVQSVDLPVTFDMESGYGRSPADLLANVTRAIEAGAIGINFEDQIIDGEGLYSIEEQSAHIQAARQAADRAGVPLFINARTDIYLKADVATHNDQHLEEAIRRAEAYAKAGANGFYPIGLADAERIGRLCAASPLPINILMRPNVPSSKQLAALGVARISYAGGPYRLVINALKEAAQKALE